jgi:hypothetical protein
MFAFPNLKTTMSAAILAATRGGSGGASLRSIVLGGAVLVASLAATSNAQAWGICGRGPWVSLPLQTQTWGEASECSCGNGQMGSISLVSNMLWATLSAWNGPNGGGAGGEAEATDTWTGDRVFIGFNFANSSPYVLGVKKGYQYNGWYGRPPIDGDNRYAPTGRYRSVCVTNFASLPKSPSYPWTW